MDDRRLLEKAAKAAGLQFSDGRQLNPRVYLVRAAGEDWRGWNPLTDDGDALRLAVKLHLAPQDRCSIVRAAAAIGESA